MRVTTNASVAVLFQRIGPYHKARLCAAAKVLPLVSVQGCEQDATYRWDKVGHNGEYPLVTLFRNGDASHAPAREISQRLATALDEIKPGVVVVPGWSVRLALAALNWCIGARKPAIIMSESTAWDDHRSVCKESVKRRILRVCSSALAGGSPQRDYLQQLGASSDRIFLGYDAVDNDYFAREAGLVERQQLGNAKGLPREFFLASCRFIEKKNLPRLIEAYHRYRTIATQTSDRRPWKMVLLGDGPLRPALQSQIEAFKLQDHIQLPGFRQYPELPSYYALAGAFIHASTIEQWGLVVNEAMASGLPVIVSNRCGCARDLVKEGLNGFTFDPFNADALAQLMSRVARLDEEGKAKMGAESRRIIAEWGVKRFADGLESAVAKALEVGPPRVSLFDRGLLHALMLR